jgi:hypothetical protein
MKTNWQDEFSEEYRMTIVNQSGVINLLADDRGWHVLVLDQETRELFGGATHLPLPLSALTPENMAIEHVLHSPDAKGVRAVKVTHRQGED